MKIQLLVPLLAASLASASSSNAGPSRLARSASDGYHQCFADNFSKSIKTTCVAYSYTPECKLLKQLDSCLTHRLETLNGKPPSDVSLENMLDTCLSLSPDYLESLKLNNPDAQLIRQAVGYAQGTAQAVNQRCSEGQ
ncbi:hypothetical protein BDV26DRAFT_297403 [Aspergillus bertholletiae]|uniref:Secreted protein n=1 Tax=Aspergillus bertholletiae TaxID=1226010 RepID=A0A5N7ASR9_9EURO|nr:hypothetical protein BDV26DRAFT_297403 [Aspergillus bertholletiae]